MANKMHRFVFPLVGLLAVACLAADDPVVPAGVTYKKTTGAINDAAKDKILKLFTGKPSDKDVLAFWKVLAARDDYKDAKLRKLTTDELNLYWAMISFDISEPVYVLETKKSTILLQFTSPDDLRVMWIDDFANEKLNKPATQPAAPK